MFAVMGKLNEVSGYISPDVKTLRTIVGFVPQEDIMHRELTVLENIRFSAQYRQEKGTSRARYNRL